MNMNYNMSYTENGARAMRSTGNACLDAFSSLGAMKNSSEDEIIRVFIEAFNENRNDAMRILFYMRDIRGGQGARRVFRVIFKWLAYTYPEYVRNNLDNILYYGRGDDLLCLLDVSQMYSDVIKYIKKVLKEDYEHFKRNEPCSLLAKWLPSENASSIETRRLANKIIDGLGWTPRNYRRFLSTMRSYLKVVEQKMSAGEWKNIDYNLTPGKAAINYRNAFMAHDPDGYTNYLKEVAIGKAKVNANALYPYDVVHQCFGCNPSIADRLMFDAMWENLPDYFENKTETGICVVDTSGSMYGQPIEVAISLGMYCADKCKGPYAGKFITFSDTPALQSISGGDIVEKVKNLNNADWDGTTNIEKVFMLILQTAIKNYCDPSEMPDKVYIISDMQFNSAISKYSHSFYRYYGVREEPKNETLMTDLKKRFAAAGYEIPALVYWNVRESNCAMYQESCMGENCCMVSGYSPSLFKAVINGTTYEEEEVITDDGKVINTVHAVIDPMTVMYKAISDPRYDRVWA